MIFHQLGLEGLIPLGIGQVYSRVDGLVMRVVCCFRMFSVSCRLAISEFLYSAISTGLIIASPCSPPNFGGRENSQTQQATLKI